VGGDEKEEEEKHKRGKRAVDLEVASPQTEISV